MSEEDTAPRRVRFFGERDLANGWYVSRVAELTEQFDPQNPPRNAEDILELHNVQQYLEYGILPDSYTEQERKQANARIPQIRSAVARFFSVIDNEKFSAMVADVSREYHGDFLDLLGRNNAFERCDSVTVLPALVAVGVHLGEMLASQKLVRTYDAEMRDLLRASSQGAEYLVRKYLQDDARGNVHFPPSFTPTDARELLERYIDSDEANPNYLRLIENAKENPQAGIDAKLKLRAKRRGDRIVATLFDQDDGIRLSCEVGISETQDEAVLVELDTSQGWATRYTYGNRWLEGTCDNPSVLNNFLHLFEFVDRHVLLVLPSYSARLGVMERVIGAAGKAEYKTGVYFRTTDTRTILQTQFYRQYLESKNIDLEQVVSWFFESYLADEFGASNFSFTPSGAGISYLQRVRHLFAEMEGVANQFSLFVEHGELDPDLLAMGSDQVRYKEVPSLLQGKYIYPSGAGEIVGILNLLFSDQSQLAYINDDLKAGNASDLLRKNKVAYADFHGYQKASVDYLINLGVLEDTGTRVQFANAEQFLILNALSKTEAASYYHLSDAGRAQADAMEAKGWVTRCSSLLTDAEGKYFNYMLNKVDFSSGPNLRNSYLHGLQVNADGEGAHFRTYITALRLTVALVIKMNDDFCLSAIEKSRP